MQHAPRGTREGVTGRRVCPRFPLRLAPTWEHGRAPCVPCVPSVPCVPVFPVCVQDTTPQEYMAGGACISAAPTYPPTHPLPHPPAGSSHHVPRTRAEEEVVG